MFDFLLQLFYKLPKFNKPVVPIVEKTLEVRPSVDYRYNLLNAHNKYHSRTMTLSFELNDYAQKHAEWMAHNNNLKHSTETQLHGLLSHNYHIAAENIARGQKTVDEVMYSWLHSPGHKSNIVNTQHREVGFGCARSHNGQLYWCAVFRG